MTPTEKQIQTLNSYNADFLDEIKQLPQYKDGLNVGSFVTFQVNIGKKCNQACKHCHVDASPSRTEMMAKETIDQCLSIIENTPTIQTVDITGGAPEMHEHFVYFVKEVRKLDRNVIDRCNLTILEEEGYEYLYDFLTENKVEIVSSLPHFSAYNTDKQRGTGVFAKSITALQKLNKKGYGSNLPLNLVYNPAGFFLSGSQASLEKEFKQQLYNNFGIVFNSLFCINNIPINRFLESLKRKNKFEEYMDMLVNAYNPNTVDGLMCRTQISVSYDGFIYDCDFNQMLDIKSEEIEHVSNFHLDSFLRRKVKTGNHCFACTAGQGSSCGGEIAAS